MLVAIAVGWLIFGITGLQSGANLQATYSPDLNLQVKLGAPGSLGQSNVDDKTFLGTPDVLLQPVLTCNPAAIQRRTSSSMAPASRCRRSGPTVPSISHTCIAWPTSTRTLRSRKALP